MTKKRALTSYLSTVLNQDKLDDALKKAVKRIKKKDFPKFDAIAFRGYSGALFASALALKLKKDLILIRKSENAHSWKAVEGANKSKRYIIIDDFISSGETVRACLDKVTKFATKAKCVGIFLYAATSDSFDQIKGVKVYTTRGL